MTTEHFALVVKPGDETPDRLANLPVERLASVPETAGTYGFFRLTLPPGAGHDSGAIGPAVGLYVVSGELTIDAGDGPSSVPAGGFAIAPAGSSLRLANGGTGDLTAMIVVAPADRAPASTGGRIAIKGPDEGPAFGVVGDLYTFLAFGEETDGGFGLWDAVVPPGGGPPVHIQSREHEGFYVLDGEVVFHADGARVEAGPGTFLDVPPGCPHAFKNESDRPVHMLIWVAPAGLERMFLETGVAMPDRSGPIPPPSPEGIAKLLAVAPRFGVTIEVPEHP